MNYLNLTDVQLDALKEISNIGMGHAATALSQLIGKRILMNVPRVSLLDIRTVPNALGGAERLVVGIGLHVLGDARGDILIVFPRESAIALLEHLLGTRPCPTGILGDMEISTLKEVGNILASAYLNALGSLLKMTLIPSIPHFTMDMAGAVVDYVLIKLGRLGDQSLMVETEFSNEGERICGQFFLLPDPDSLELILHTAGVSCD